MTESNLDPAEHERVLKVWKEAHRLDKYKVLIEMRVDLKKGLSSEEVEKRLKIHGRNELPKKPPKSIWASIAEQFKDVLVLILLGAALVSFLIATFGGEAEEEGIKAYVEPFVILLILVANATIGVLQEMNAEKALEALMKMQTAYTKVRRDGEVVKIPVGEVVPGDICLLEGGDKIPADVRCVEAMALKVSQAILTGESEPISKDPEYLVTKDIAQSQDKLNMLFSATEVLTGQATGVAVGTGEHSELGNIQKLMQSAAENQEKTPLKKNLEKFGEMLSYIVAIICVISWLINIPKFSDPGHGTWYQAALYYFKISVSLAVAAIPEGLPAVITTCLALATGRMAKINAIIRDLSSVETLGCTTVICSDKTGTLTLNNMTVIEYNYFGKGEEPITHTVSSGNEDHIEKMTSENFNSSNLLRECAIVSALCNDASMKYDPDNKTKVISVGTPTEVAIKVFAKKLGLYDPKYAKDKNETLEWYADVLNKDNPQIVKLPFTRDRKAMSVIVESRSNRGSLLTKGAAEVVLARCCTKIKLSDNSVVDLTPEIRESLKKSIARSTSLGLRCIALAIRENISEYNGRNKDELQKMAADVSNYAKLENNCTFLGYVGIQDPPRKEVKPAIAKCKEAGIRVIMITGDNKDTASAIAKNLDLLEADDDPKKLSLEGSEFDALITNEAKLKKLHEEVKVFSRVEPRHKIELVTLLQKEMGEVVAMTGDGVNDGPALKQANIGIAMGIAGSDVAKEASKMVLADDNFATIVNAIEEGRAIYTNIKSFIRYLISSNIGEVVAVFLGSLLGIPEVLTSVQLLWMNLVTDGLPAIALGFNPPEVGIMKQMPRKKDEAIIGGWSLVRYMIVGTYVGIASVAIYIHWYIHMETEDNHKLVTFNMLRTWTKCSTWDEATKKMATIHKECDLFELDGPRATSMSLSVLVVLEMIGALNALSESQSLLVTPPWKNGWLCGAITLSLSLHFLIMYIPIFQMIFAVAPLTKKEWMWILIYAAPGIVIEEVIKVINRSQIYKTKAHVHHHEKHE